MKRGVRENELQSSRAIKKSRFALDTYRDFIDNSFPEDIWIEIARYLEPEELYTLQLVSKVFLDLGSTDTLWQSLLNRLHAIDESISVNPRMGQSIREAFIEGFSLVKNHQRNEMNYLACNNLYIAPGFQNSLSDLEAISEKLDAVNDALISTTLTEAIRIKSQTLDLTNLYLTRLSRKSLIEKGPIDFWQNLIILNCANNNISILPKWICKLPSLQELILNNNLLESLPESIGNLSTLESLELDSNRLQLITESIVNLQQLNFLWCQYNYLESLPESISNMPSLKGLYCKGNYLKSLPESICNKFYDDWSHQMLREQNLPDYDTSESEFSDEMELDDPEEIDENEQNMRLSSRRMSR